MNLTNEELQVLIDEISGWVGFYERPRGQIEHIHKSEREWFAQQAALYKKILNKLEAEKEGKRPLCPFCEGEQVHKAEFGYHKMYFEIGKLVVDTEGEHEAVTASFDINCCPICGRTMEVKEK